ncbi:hypothetical protein DFH06DRAFT_1127398 [Mycena polygramma]|nr:hypothetical protein DFH06DRAFT_1351467 [Mycena polygramma]KAJ7665019.1 hypothetical protein DFH06DRAFT_1127398 [Mycena polygramma]
MATPSQTASRASNLDLEIADRLELVSDRELVQTESDTVFYPVLTLPVEIVSQIFCWTLAPGGQDPEFTPLEKPLRLGQICGLWRQIALSGPELWNNIHLDVDRRSHLFERHYAFRVDTFLSRAASLPLSISVVICISEIFFEQQTYILQFLHAPRLRELKLITHQVTNLTVPLANPDSLERFSLSIISAYATATGGASQGILRCLAPLSALHTLKLAVRNPVATSASLNPFISRLATDAGFLPALQSLTILVGEDFLPAFKSSALVDMLRARRHSTLRYFELRTYFFIPGFDSGCEAVADLVATGMQICIEAGVEMNRGLDWDEF